MRRHSVLRAWRPPRHHTQPQYRVRAGGRAGVQVLGVENVVSFFTHCFDEREYVLTHLGDDVHDELWRYYDEERDGALD